MNFTASFHNACQFGRDLGRKASRILEDSEGWQVALYVALGQVALYVALGLMAMAVVLPLALGLALLALVVAVVLAWVHEFVFLMRLGDDAFPGRHDKLVWCALMIVLPPIGLLAFWSFRKVHWIEEKPSARKVDDWL